MCVGGMAKGPRPFCPRPPSTSIPLCVRMATPYGRWARGSQQGGRNWVKAGMAWVWICRPAQHPESVHQLSDSREP